MPLYDYQCTACGHEMEVLQKMSDDPLTECPECHSASFKKKVTAAAFRLSGSGWYETDFKSGDKRNLVDSGSDTKSDKKPEKSSDTPKTTTPSPAPATSKNKPASDKG